jgi:prepilin-type N-terminal cleavage/methylation domain-containing protein
MSTGGFTLIEVLAAVLLTSIVLTVAVSIFINISNATNAATSRMRDARHAVAILDRIAHDLESAFLLVKPAEMDPLEHPWIFLAQSEYGDASDRLKFVVRNHKRRRSDGHSSDIAVVTYALTPGESGTYDLLRSTNPNLPERLDYEIPIDEEDGAMLLAEGVESFSVRFLDEGGTWRDQWDSAQLVDSGSLPVAAEIEIALASTDGRYQRDSGLSGDDEDAGQGLVYKRKVAIPMRPMPLDQIIDDYVAGVPDGEGGEKGSDKYEAGDCEMTLEECAIQNQSKIIKSKGEEGYEDCLRVLAKRCAEEPPGGRICGVVPTQSCRP